MRYIANTDQQKREMLKEIGVSSFEELIGTIPEEMRFRGELDIPGPLSEAELEEEFADLAKRNADFTSLKPLIGAGAYKHHLPRAIQALLGREEFYTSYTPYQPELSQGTLQAMFELQTYLARLTGMEVVIPSVYDGASATAEAALMSLRLTRKNRIIISSTLHPHYRSVVETYTAPHGTEIIELPYQDGLVAGPRLEKVLTDDTAAVIVQSPNFFGGIEKIAELAGLAHARSALFIQVVAESISLGLLKTPGEMDVDIVAGEAQSLGMELSFGGPYNGYLGARKKYLRQLPGRIAGETVDRDGKRVFVMTSRAREQDIRREKATSCICSNHGLNIIASDIYLSLLGTEGFYQTALLNTRAAHYLEERLVASGGFERVFDYPFFNEFLLRSKKPLPGIRASLLEAGFLPPLALGAFIGDESLENTALFCVTEIFSREKLNRVTQLLST
ncbi:MAG: aminomethyl-transferring glycine dehydrogenase subunit GcvPA [Candidatus Euphemobacter frigidus]|nr:aminomethyl-transferring glycine dehydrogenase subunit GcvPA [Candidatus Euphemobacter frigidus]MDP8276368.1 aminomethyl-transferring glycine dehydrogenase subunit GcvPA [Candidatus Euphemobacter frigidus]